MRSLRIAVAAVAVLALLPASVTGAPRGGGKVEISGRAYAFNHMDTFLAGAVIKVREMPRLSATTDASGDYELKVPDDASVTPYIEPPAGYHQIDLQTFHTRGKNISNANFQTPGDAEYFGLAAILAEPLGPDMRPVNCVIVTTASARNVRGVDYETFEERTPHGVPGAMGISAPAIAGPTYFNENVIPDSSETETSEDGGMIWTSVPAGTYRISATHPEARFASFLATCEPGRVVNANPPWGTYELKRKEHPLGAGVVAGSVGHARLISRRGRDFVRFTVDAAERLAVRARLEGANERTPVRRLEIGRTGRKKLRIPAPARVLRDLPILEVDLIDAAGDRAGELLAVRGRPDPRDG